MYCTALKNFRFRVPCITLFVLISLIFIGVTAGAHKKKAAKRSHLTSIVREENNQIPASVKVSIQKERKRTASSVSNSYVFVLTPGMYNVLIGSKTFSPQRISGLIIKSNEQTRPAYLLYS